jgi:glycosyltransferase involved in cell wall biosynthesis
VAYSDTKGGAARAGYRLHRALIGSGVDSRMRVRHKGTGDPTVHAAVKPIAMIDRGLRIVVGQWIAGLQRASTTVIRSANSLPSSWSRPINAGSSNVVNLHWVGLDTMSIADIGRIRKPVVFTLHDMWPFAGAQHLSADEFGAGWWSGHDSARQADLRRGLDIDGWTWRRKRRHWRPMHLVAPSIWMAGRARSSALMQGWRVHTIPNAIDLDIFAPTDRRLARRELGLPATGQIIVFGADGGAANPHKGFDLLVAALSRWERGGERPTLIIFGGRQPASLVGQLMDARWIGRISDDSRIALLYSAADAVVVPSRQDNLPQVGVEAQACGTPVVAFRTHGLPDVVEHGVTGYLAEPYDTDSLATGIRWATSEERAAELSANARRRAIRLWSPRVVARQYMHVYTEALADSSLR